MASLKRKHYITTGWILAVLWFLSIFFIVQDGDPFGSLDADSANRNITLLLLVPIAVLSMPLAYNIDFSLYMTKRAASKISRLERVLFSLFLTAVILMVSWYVFIILSFARWCMC